MTPHAWRDTGTGLTVAGGSRPRPVYACDRCGSRSLTGYESELDLGPSAWSRRQESVDRAKRIRVRVVGNRRTGEAVAEDCDEELARRTLES